MMPGMADFIATGAKVMTRPQEHTVKRITKIVRANPGQKICYHYEKIHRVTFEDGSSIEVSNDYIEGHAQFKVGGYVIATRPDFSFGFCTAEQFKEMYQ